MTPEDRTLVIEKIKQNLRLHYAEETPHFCH